MWESAWGAASDRVWLTPDLLRSLGSGARFPELPPLRTNDDPISTLFPTSRRTQQTPRLRSRGALSDGGTGVGSSEVSNALSPQGGPRPGGGQRLRRLARAPHPPAPSGLSASVSPNTVRAQLCRWEPASQGGKGECELTSHALGRSVPHVPSCQPPLQIF